MTTIRLTNSKTRRKEVFAPIDPDNVRMYVCGPTVYDRAHLGNARPVVVFDVLFRLLRHVYGADHVTYVRNFTDVDDKINARAAESGRPIGEITAETTQWYLEDMAALGALEPTHMPRATDHIGSQLPDGSWTGMIGMIETLIEKGFAYSVRSESNNPPEEFVLADRERMFSETALFQVEKYDRYGRLSGRSLDDMIAGARVEVAPYKRNPMDFVLWKPSTDDLPGWDSPWGRGRPGWHIECSAMAKELLGDVFDIHGGGNDLMFPHHENEIAQSCCANGTDEMARVWLHNEMLQVEGRKMSKSLGNFFTVRDLLDQDIPGEVIRFVFLSTHYRKPMDWTAEKAREAKELLWKWKQFTSGAETSYRPHADVVDALADDLNTPLAISLLHQKFKAARSDVDRNRFRATLELLGIGKRWPSGVSIAVENAAKTVGLLNELAERLQETRLAAMATNDFAAVDQLKSALIEAGVEVRMSKAGVELVPGPDFDPAKLEGLL